MESETRQKLIQAATAYDIKQSTRKGYNPYALGHYFTAIGNIETDTRVGIELETAIRRNTSDRFCAALLKAVGLKF